MKTNLLTLATLVSLLAPLTLSAQNADPEATTASLDTYVDGMFATMDSGDLSVLETTNTDAIIYDVDGELQPISVQGVVWNSRIRELILSLQLGGYQIDYTVSQRNCLAVGGTGYCAIGFATAATAGGNTSHMRWRMTLVAQHDGTQWVMMHLHNSPGA